MFSPLRVLKFLSLEWLRNGMKLSLVTNTFRLVFLEELFHAFEQENGTTAKHYSFYGKRGKEENKQHT